jgi:hypothetical protein
LVPIFFNTNGANVDRAFFIDVLGLKSPDAGRGWLILLSRAEAKMRLRGGSDIGLCRPKHRRRSRLASQLFVSVRSPGCGPIVDPPEGGR